MHLEPPVFRPPSEAFSLILQLTIGCRHNACTFCGSFRSKKFRIKSWEEMKNDIDSCAQQMIGTQRIFLADGDALAAPAPLIIQTVERLYSKFPGLERVTMYAGPLDILAKSEAELKEIRQAGVTMLYMGLESGNEAILKAVCKGVNPTEMIEAGRKAMAAGFELSVTIIDGLGGTALWREHATDTAKVLSAIDPNYAGTLTLMVLRNTPLYRRVQRGEFEVPDTMGFLAELKCLLENVNLTNCVFRSNHASNYLPLGGVLNRDRDRLVALLEKAITQPGDIPLRPEKSRRL
ncbi:MAG: radical SAM protein [Firmicutes bacterium]|nr:radical SAM protein [Bacillota bacterium]